ncbi:MAG: helix-turn-helix transcriptional regulator [Bryobacterales bacterium]|nr:helix-turn-helix transcriptional regulator [Bryobacterales bacterium]
MSFRVNPHTGVDISYKERHPEYASIDTGHDFWELLYVDRGQIKLFLDGAPFMLEQGEFVIILPRQMHGVAPSGAAAPFYVTVHFDTNIVALRDLGSTILKADEEGRRLLRRMLEEKVNPEIGSYALARFHFAEFLIRAIRHHPRRAPTQSLSSYIQANAQERIVQLAIDYLTANLEKTICLQDLARAVGVSKSHLEHTFKKLTNRSVMSHLQELRIQRAKELLLESCLNVSAIAAECGYSSLPLFSRRFKKLVAISPTEYTRTIRAGLPPSRSPMQMLGKGCQRQFRNVGV